MNVLLLALGGGIGAIARYLVGLAMMKRYLDPPFPVAMLVVNLIGSFGLGAFFGGYFQEIPLGAYEDPLFLTVGIGFFGAFTTYSTFSVEASMLLKAKQWRKLSLYIGFSIIGSILFFLLGFSMLVAFTS
ncbi:fluoride efflux transporter CrcB [Alkalihalophilus lindianensis]|uniref:Fluoride-specific ion channel FluC n=1 Tax=Alkalihalophilus lindianensis TaxID=1630542 RepID=A0ABU3X552_9BACI|nr:fluoride efflux transporter CrcB [Alkalihalophilus lindianensis]MDV2683016.1 fluoride efflux transporter CrcB [Alkalihalophilus lindianensis]